MIVINAAKLNEILKIIDTITTEFIVKFDDTGMHLYTGDSANVMRCFIDVDKEWFTIYSPTQETYALSLSNIKNIVAKANKNSNVTFTSDSYGKKISINFVENDIAYQGVFTGINPSQMHVINDMGEKFYTTVNRDYSIVDINVGRLITVLSALSPFYSSNDACKDIFFSLTEDGMGIAAGDEFNGNTMNCDIPVKTVKVIADADAYPITNIILSTYITMMKAILNACGSDEDISFYSKTNLPIYFKTDIHDKMCHIKFLCACRVSN